MNESRPNLRELKEALGRRIRVARVQGRMTQRILGKRIGVSGVAISDWERGISQPNAILLSQVAAVVGIPPNDLLGHPAQSTEYMDDDTEEYVLELFRALTPESKLKALSFLRRAIYEQSDCRCDATG